MPDPSRARLQCFVDDPILAVVGDAQYRRTQALKVVLWWAALRAQLSWPKVEHGTSVDWIGVRITVHPFDGAVVVTLPEKKLVQLQETVSKHLAAPRGMVKASDLRALAGLGSWIGGVLPQVRPFIQQLWAAMAAPRDPKLAGLVYFKQVKSALEWLQVFAQANATAPVTRTCWVTDAYRVAITMEVDASPWGGGAVLWRGSPRSRHLVRPLAWLSCLWQAEDASLLQCKIGEPDGQARWEAFMFAIALRQWIRPGLTGRIVIVGDAEGVISSLTKLKSKDWIINSMAKEVALLLAPLGLSLIGLHIWGEENTWADALSRSAVPAQLQQVPREEPAARSSADWNLLGRL